MDTGRDGQVGLLECETQDVCESVSLLVCLRFPSQISLFIRLCTCYGASGEENISPRNCPQRHEEGRVIQHHRQAGMKWVNNALLLLTKTKTNKNLLIEKKLQ